MDHQVQAYPLPEVSKGPAGDSCHKQLMLEIATFQSVIKLANVCLHNAAA